MNTLLLLSLVWQPNLLEAAARLDLEMARKLLEEGANVNVVNRLGETPLMLAAKMGYDRMIQLLLEHNAQLEAISNTGETALFYAVRSGRLEAARFLVERGCPINSKNRKGISPPIIALTRDDPAMLHVLLQAGTDPELADERGESLLHKAVLMGNLPFTELLIRAGADPEAKKKGIPAPAKLAKITQHTGIINVIQKPPTKHAPVDSLGLALIMGDWERARTFLPADLTTLNESGDTPLILAVKAGYEKPVASLLERGVDVNAKGSQGRTALMEAVYRGRIALVPILLSAGADPNAVTGKGASTPISIAFQNSDLVTLNFLVRAGGRLITLDGQGGEVALPIPRLRLNIIQDAVQEHEPEYPVTGFGPGPRRGGVYPEDHPGLTKPVFTKQPAPKFPDKVKGIPSIATVSLEAVFDPDGRTREISVVKLAHGGIFGFETKAVENLTLWKFQTGKIDGKPVPVRTKIDVQFFMD